MREFRGRETGEPGLSSDVIEAAAIQAFGKHDK
jgi:hypothetical protein